MTVAVKICGLNDPGAVAAAVRAGADYLGFVFFPRSPRAVTPETAATLAAAVPEQVRRVGLFVEPDAAAIEAVLRATRLDVLQLYASPRRAAALGAEFALPVWRVVSVATAADLPASAEGAEALLLDAEPAADATRPGGNARAFDWSMIADWSAPSRFVLAGGLTAANVAEAVRITAAPIVDVSSGVERAPGVKDPALIRAFIAAARG